MTSAPATRWGALLKGVTMPQMQQKLRKGGKNMTTSIHRKERYAFYKTHTYAEHKLKHILQSCGLLSAQKWARNHLADNVLQRMLQ
jgi:predicted hydrolase (HD superfamily)